MNRVNLKNRSFGDGVVFLRQKNIFSRDRHFFRFGETAFFASKFKFAWYIV